MHLVNENFFYALYFTFTKVQKVLQHQRCLILIPKIVCFLKLSSLKILKGVQEVYKNYKFTTFDIQSYPHSHRNKNYPPHVFDPNLYFNPVGNISKHYSLLAAPHTLGEKLTEISGLK